MSISFNLPTDIFKFEVICKFLTINDVMTLDTAFTNKASRNIITDVYPSIVNMEECIFDCPDKRFVSVKFIAWIRRRHIQLKSLNLNNTILLKEALLPSSELPEIIVKYMRTISSSGCRNVQHLIDVILMNKKIDVVHHFILNKLLTTSDEMEDEMNNRLRNFFDRVGKELLTCDLNRCVYIGRHVLFHMAENCPKITTLDVSKITSFDNDTLKHITLKCKYLTDINFSQCGINETGMKKFFNTVEGKLVSINLSYCTGLGMMLFQAMESMCISHGNTIKTLILNNINEFDATSHHSKMKMIGESCPKLESLGLSRTMSAVCDVGMEVLCTNCPNITSLDLSGSSKLTSVTWKHIIPQYLKKLKVIKYHHSRLRTAEFLNIMLQIFCDVVYVDMYLGIVHGTMKNDIDYMSIQDAVNIDIETTYNDCIAPYLLAPNGDAIKHIAICNLSTWAVMPLSFQFTLTSLTFYRIRLSVAALRAISSTCKLLTEWNLSHCKGVSVADMLGDNVCLKKISLANCNGSCISPIAQGCSKLRSLNLSNYQFELEELHTIIRRCTQLVYLCITEGTINDEDKQVIWAMSCVLNEIEETPATVNLVVGDDLVVLDV